jgi:hypothetical protein
MSGWCEERERARWCCYDTGRRARLTLQPAGIFFANSADRFVNTKAKPIPLIYFPDKLELGRTLRPERVLSFHRLLMT